MDELIVTETSAPEYFHELLGAAIARQRARLEPLTERYLVELLAKFVDAARLYESRPGGGRDEVPLALILQRAIEGVGPVRREALKVLGDRSLYVAGFFGDSLERKLVDINYYVAMGAGAYEALSVLRRERRVNRSLAALYAELGRKFRQIVELFTEVSERSAMNSQTGVLKLYERWLKSGSRTLARLLAERGALPTFGPGITQ